MRQDDGGRGRFLAGVGDMLVRKPSRITGQCWEPAGDLWPGDPGHIHSWCSQHGSHVTSLQTSP